MMRLKQALVPLSFLFGMASILFIWWGDPGNVVFLTREDGVVENFTAIFFLVGFIISLFRVFRNENVLFPIIWTALCFLFLGEETSWFQRLFDYSVLSVEQVNSQNEFNLHNLAIFQGGHLVGQSEEFGYNMLLKAQNLFRMGFFGYFVILPLLLYNAKINNLLQKIGYPKPSSGFTLTVLFVLVLSFVLALKSDPQIKSALAETREMLYAFFIMVYIVAYMTKKTQPTVG